MSVKVAEHHQRAAQKAEERLLAEPDVLAVLMAGSVARGVARPESDVDLIAVVDDRTWAARLSESRAAFLWKDLADYAEGYVEGRYVSKAFVLEAAVRGSEPTRHSFLGVYPIYSRDPEIDSALPLIPVYPERERQHRIDSFMAQFNLNRWFFWHEGKRRNDRYLHTRAATDIVLFGGRLILAHNRILFPCQKRLVEYVEAAPSKPAGFKVRAENLLTQMTDEALNAFCAPIESLTDWGVKTDALGLFLRNVELGWHERLPAIAEW